MPKFYPLTVTGVDRLTSEAVMVTLKPEIENKETFKFEQGQYITFRKTMKSEELHRSYSICAPKDASELRVGIKKVDDGWFSTWANEEMKIGDTIDAMAPDGRFTLPLDPSLGRHYLNFAIGSGITPILSIVATVLEQEPKARCTLVYGNRTVHSIMFRETIEDLKNLYMDRFKIVHILKNNGGDIDLFNGRLDRQKCEDLFDKWIDLDDIDYAFICGPEEMTMSTRDALQERGLKPEQIKYELFASSPRKAYEGGVRITEAAKSVETIELGIILDGITQTIDSPKNASILEATLDHQIEAPFSCKAGVCSTCRCRVIEGEVEMRANHGLEDYEVDNGFVLSCQSYPLTEKVVISFDDH